MVADLISVFVPRYGNWAKERSTETLSLDFFFSFKVLSPYKGIIAYPEKSVKCFWLRFTLLV